MIVNTIWGGNLETKKKHAKKKKKLEINNIKILRWTHSKNI